MDRRLLLEIERHAEDLRRLQAKDRVPDELHIFESVGWNEVNSAVTHVAGEEDRWHMAPFYLPKAMQVRRFLAWVGKTGAAATVTYKAALYRVVNGGAAQRDGVRLDGASDGAGAVGMSGAMNPPLRAELLERFTPFRTSTTGVEQYRHDLQRDMLLKPGFYAIGYSVSDVEGMWFYGPTLGVACGYRCHHATEATGAPQNLEARALAAPLPHFVLRSNAGIRMRPYNDEVNSVW